MNSRGPLAQLLIFVAVLVVINTISYLAGWSFRVSIIGSVVLSIVMSVIMGALYRRN